MRSEKASASFVYLLPLGLCCAALFYFLGSYGLLDNNEGLYAQIAQEMLTSGNYIIPHLNGVPYLEKPPLLYWLIALSFKVLGVHETAARLVPALSALGVLVLVYKALHRRVSKEAGILACLVLGTSLGYVTFARTLLFDMLFTMCLTGALFSLFELAEQKKSQPQPASSYFFLSFYIFLGLAVLAKGLLALVLGGLVWVTYFAIEGRKRVSFWSPLHLWGLIVFTAITVPWHLLAALQESSFAWFYFVNEHFLRFLGLREPYDYYTGPFYYYTYRLLIYFAPWILVLPFLSGDLLRVVQNKTASSSEAPSERGRFLVFLGCWFATVFLFFSFSKAKANYYLVTVMPPLAVLLSLFLLKITTPQTDRRIFVGGQGLLLLTSTLFLLVFLSPVFPMALGEYLPFFEKIPLGLRGSLWGASLLGFGMVGLYQLCRRWQFSLWPYLPLGSFCFLILMAGSQAVPFYETQLSQKKNAQEALRQFKGPFHLYREYEAVSSLRFYLPGPLQIVDSLSQDLLFGQQQGKSDAFIDKEAFRKKGGLIFVRKNREGEFLGYFPDAQKRELTLDQSKLTLYQVFATP